MGREHVGPPPREDKRELTEAVIRSGVGFTPILGAPLAELATVIIERAIPRRREAWLKKLGEVVDYLVDHSVDIDSLAENDAFVSVVQEASEAATRTGDEEKLRALRNAVTRSALAISLDEHTQLMFIRYVQELTPLHFQILAFVDDPGSWFQKYDLPRPNIYMGSRSAVLEAAFPQLQNRRELYGQMLNDLESRGLINGASSIFTMVTEQGLYQPLTRPAGKQFLDFVSDPPAR